MAYFVAAPARHAANGKIGLRYTHGGFGTPYFGDGRQVRVENGVLVSQGGVYETRPLTTISDACSLFDLPYRETWFEEGFRDPPIPGDPNAPLDVDEESALALGEWFGFGASVLEQTRRTAGAVEVSRVQLWPEHFDLAIEMGPRSLEPLTAPRPVMITIQGPTSMSRPGAPSIDPIPTGTTATFNGASLTYPKLLEAEDQRATALAFFAEGHRLLNP